MSTKGFTIVEILIVMVVSGVLIGLLYGPLVSLYYDTMSSIKKVSVTADARKAVDMMQDTIQTSTGFLTQNAVKDPSDATDPLWKATNGGINNVLITTNNATTIDSGADTDGNRRLVLATDCMTPLQNNYIFFLKDKNLYRRLLRNEGSTCSDANGQKQTCVANYASQTYKAKCQGIDAKLASGVTSFTIKYYANPEDSTTITNPAAASTVVLNITVQTGAGTQAISSSSSLRVSHVN